MRWLAKTILVIAVNALVLAAMAKYLPGFKITGDFKAIIAVALIFAALNFLLKPVLKLILGPIIVLTLGVGLILVNMVVLFVLDKLAKNLTIEGTVTLFYSAIIVGVINFVLHLAFKK